MADKAGGKSKSARYYAANPKAKAKKAKYDTKYHSTKERKAYRAELGRKNTAAGNKVGDGKDVSHKKGGGTTSEGRSKNRARQGAGGKAKKK